MVKFNFDPFESRLPQMVVWLMVLVVGATSGILVFLKQEEAMVVEHNRPINKNF
ncbi:MAG: hypothetical protein ACK4S0_09215 [Sediminibacterium sp.]